MVVPACAHSKTTTIPSLIFSIALLVIYSRGELYKLSVRVGYSGSDDYFIFLVRGEKTNMRMQANKLIAEQERVMYMDTSLGVIKWISVKGTGVDGLHIISMSVRTKSRFHEVDCNCVVDNKHSVIKKIDRTVCLDLSCGSFCRYVNYVIKIAVEDSVKASKLQIELTGIYGRATIHLSNLKKLKNTPHFLVSKMMENIGLISNVTIINAELTVIINWIAISDTKYEYEFDFSSPIEVKHRESISVGVSKTICLCGLDKENICHVHRYTFNLYASEGNLFNKSDQIVVINATGKEPESHEFDTTAGNGKGVLTLTRDIVYLGFLRNLHIVSPVPLKSIEVNDGRVHYMFPSYGATNATVYPQHYGCVVADDSCIKVHYEVSLTVGPKPTDGTRDKILVLLTGTAGTGAMEKSEVYASPRSTIFLNAVTKNIKIILEIDVNTDGRDQIVIARASVSDGRITYIFSAKRSKKLTLHRVYCPAGWYGKRCSMGCRRKRWGVNCAQRCRCANNAECDAVSGYCPSGCDVRNTGIACMKSCKPGKFGESCDGTCHCVSEAECNVVTGECGDKGCTPRWTGPNCQFAVCESGHKFGPGCAQACHCRDRLCDPHTGACPGGCDDRYYGAACQEMCPRGYRAGNSSGCERCRCDMPHACRASDGVCLFGSCEKGWIGNTCEERCVYGKPPCDKLCDCVDRPCDMLNGSCDCGFRRFGNSCRETCNFGFFRSPEDNQSCNGICHCNDDLRCQVWDGVCAPSVGCRRSWTGPACQEPVGNNDNSEMTIIGSVSAAVAFILGSFVTVLIALHSKCRKKPQTRSVTSMSLDEALNFRTPPSKKSSSSRVDRSPIELDSANVSEWTRRLLEDAGKTRIAPITEDISFTNLGKSKALYRGSAHKDKTGRLEKKKENKDVKYVSKHKSNMYGRRERRAPVTPWTWLKIKLKLKRRSNSRSPDTVRDMGEYSGGNAPSHRLIRRWRDVFTPRRAAARGKMPDSLITEDRLTMKTGKKVGHEEIGDQPVEVGARPVDVSDEIKTVKSRKVKRKTVKKKIRRKATIKRPRKHVQGRCNKSKNKRDVRLDPETSQKCS